jgi:hypothetical protein
MNSPEPLVFEAILSSPRQLFLGDFVLLQYRDPTDSRLDQIALLKSIEGFHGRYVLITVELYDRNFTILGTQLCWIDGQFLMIPRLLKDNYDTSLIQNPDFVLNVL